MVAPGSEVELMVSVLPDVAALTVRLSVALADCCGWPASVAVTVIEAVPTALCAGVPLMVPEELMVSPLGKPVAVNV